MADFIFHFVLGKLLELLEFVATVITDGKNMEMLELRLRHFYELTFQGKKYVLFFPWSY